MFSFISFKFVKSLYSLTLGLLFSATCYSLQAQDEKGQLYRYKDTQGAVVINDRLPPDIVPHGYEILNMRGRVIKTVAPAPTAEELAKRDRQRALAAKQEERRKQDALLQRLYNSAHDVIRVRDRKIREIESRIAVSKGNIQRFETRIKELEGRAAAAEKLGRPVPTYIHEEVKNTRRQIEETKSGIAAKKEEIHSVNLEYENDIARMRQLDAQSGRETDQLPVANQR